MNVAKQTNSPFIRNNKQKCCLVPLVRLLLNNGKEFTGSYIKKLVELLTIEKMSSLLTTCKEIHQAAEIILFYAPKVWKNDNEVRKMFVAMTEVQDSRWMTSWVDTKKVEQMALGSSTECYEETSAVTDERFKRFIEQFPQLTSINLECCWEITDASVIEIAKGCSQLTSINLEDCKQITDTSIIEIAKGCSQLTSIDLAYSGKITDASVIEIAKGCSHLTSIDLCWCNQITDTSIIEIAKRCSQLTSINLTYCNNITDASVIEIAKGCSQLTSINLTSCNNITDASVIEVAKGCSQLSSIFLISGSNITDTTLSMLKNVAGLDVHT
jgi:hypothetical protein